MLVAVGLVVVGGLATAVAATVGTQVVSGPPDLISTGLEIESGSSWAGAVFSLILLGTLALGWWQFQRWSVASGIGGEGEEEEPPDTDVHVWRADRIVLLSQVALVINAAGAVAGFVGTLMDVAAGPSIPLDWSRAIGIGAGAVGAVVISFAGVWAGTRLRREPQAI